MAQQQQVDRWWLVRDERRVVHVAERGAARTICTLEVLDDWRRVPSHNGSSFEQLTCPVCIRELIASVKRRKERKSTRAAVARKCDRLDWRASEKRDCVHHDVCEERAARANASRVECGGCKRYERVEVTA